MDRCAGFPPGCTRHAASCRPAARALQAATRLPRRRVRPPSHGDCHTPLPCEVRKWNDTTPRACCPNSAAPGAVKPGMDDEPVVPRPCSRRQDNRKWELRARPGWASHSQIEFYGGFAGIAGSIRFDARELHHFGRLFGFVGEELTEVGG